MIDITVNISVSPHTAAMIEADPLPLSGRVYAQIEALYEERDFPQSLVGLSDGGLAAGLLFMLRLGAPLSKVRKIAETSGRGSFNDACLAAGRPRFAEELKNIEPENIPEPKIFPDARSRIQREIARGSKGFSGGWVSSVHLDELLSRQGVSNSVPLNKRRDLMATLGYVWHPALAGGRVNNPLQCDGFKKSRLYIREGHPSVSILKASEAARAYEEAQG